MSKESGRLGYGHNGKELMRSTDYMRNTNERRIEASKNIYIYDNEKQGKI